MTMNDSVFALNDQMISVPESTIRRTIAALSESMHTDIHRMKLQGCSEKDIKRCVAPTMRAIDELNLSLFIGEPAGEWSDNNA